MRGSSQWVSPGNALRKNRKKRRKRKEGKKGKRKRKREKKKREVEMNKAIQKPRMSTSLCKKK
jgi:hypothetical protein